MQALDAVQLDLDSLAGDCTHINGALAGAKAASADMVADTERVARELAASQLRSRLAEQFLQQYQLSPEEVAALQVPSSCCHAGHCKSLWSYVLQLAPSLDSYAKKQKAPVVGQRSIVQTMGWVNELHHCCAG